MWIALWVSSFDIHCRSPDDVGWDFLADVTAVSYALLTEGCEDG